MQFHLLPLEILFALIVYIPHSFSLVSPNRTWFVHVDQWEDSFLLLTNFGPNERALSASLGGKQHNRPDCYGIVMGIDAGQSLRDPW